MITALTRLPSRSIAGACELTYVERQTIDFERIEFQHRAYCAALASAGLHVVTLPALQTLPDSVFVEDVAVMFDDIAILTRPGAASRQAETLAMQDALLPYRSIVLPIEAPGTLDGGDVLRIGKRIFVGESTRTNRAAIEQLNAFVSPIGFALQTIPLDNSLHLKTAVTALDAHTLLLNPQWIDPRYFVNYARIAVAANEPFGANILMLDDALIVNSAFPRTLELVTRHAARIGKRVVPLDLSEFVKAEAGLTCLSLIFSGGKA